MKDDLLTSLGVNNPEEVFGNEELRSQFFKLIRELLGDNSAGIDLNSEHELMRGYYLRLMKEVLGYDADLVCDMAIAYATRYKKFLGQLKYTEMKAGDFSGVDGVVFNDQEFTCEAVKYWRAWMFFDDEVLASLCFIDFIFRNSNDSEVSELDGLALLLPPAFESCFITEEEEMNFCISVSRLQGPSETEASDFMVSLCFRGLDQYSLWLEDSGEVSVSLDSDQVIDGFTLRVFWEAAKLLAKDKGILID